MANRNSFSFVVLFLSFFLLFLSKPASASLQRSDTGASQCSWPSRLTLPFHLLFSCCPAKGSSRRAVPSGEPRASTPDKASRVELCSPPLPLDTHTHTDTNIFTSKYINPIHISMLHTREPKIYTHSRVSGGPFILVTSPFVFIHTTSYSFIVALLFIFSQEVRRRGFYDNAEDVE